MVIVGSMDNFIERAHARILRISFWLWFFGVWSFSLIRNIFI